jgi:hypothetical protein
LLILDSPSQQAPAFKLGETNKSEEFKQKFPFQKVPALVTANGQPLYETNAIAQYGASPERGLGMACITGFRLCLCVSVFRSPPRPTHLLSLPCLAISHRWAVASFNPKFQPADAYEQALVTQFINTADHEVCFPLPR